MTDRGRLVVVGTGIRTVGQLTMEAIAWLKVADVVFHLVADPVAESLIAEWQPESNHDLRRLYVEGQPRRDAYEAMTRAIVDEVVAGSTVCAAFYGHPGVFARPPQLAIAEVRRRGLPAEMLPGISAEDCLFADLGVDPGDGCLSFESTNFLAFDHQADPSVHLVLWQVGVLGDWTHRPDRDSSPNAALLSRKLQQWYPPDHAVVLYQASVEPKQPPRADRVRLDRLGESRLGAGCTLYVPPSTDLRRDPVYAQLIHRTR